MYLSLLAEKRKSLNANSPYEFFATSKFGREKLDKLWSGLINWLSIKVKSPM